MFDLQRVPPGSPTADWAIAQSTHERGTGVRGLRAIVERVLEPVLFDPEPWVNYRVTEASVRADKVEVIRLFDDEAAPLRRRMARRARG